MAQMKKTQATMNVTLEQLQVQAKTLNQTVDNLVQELPGIRNQLEQLENLVMIRTIEMKAQQRFESTFFELKINYIELN